jgi:hypothetical protein
MKSKDSWHKKKLEAIDILDHIGVRKLPKNTLAVYHHMCIHSFAFPFLLDAHASNRQNMAEYS